MTKKKALIDHLDRTGCRVISWRPSSRLDGLYLEEGNAAYIAVAPDLPDRRQLTTLAHEAGHHFMGITGHTGRDEERAERWATNYLLSPMDLVTATLKGARSYHDVADMLHLPEQFIRDAIEILAIQYGQEIVLEQYRLHLLPVWVECKETGQVWPDE